MLPSAIEMKATTAMTKVFLRATLSVCVFSALIQTDSNAQTTRDRKKAESTVSDRALEVRLEKAEQALVDEYKEVVVEVYKQGNKEKALSMLQRLKQLSPELDGLKDRIESINEELMQENAAEFELDTRKPWEYLGDVVEGKAFRIAAGGAYKMTITADVTVEGIQPDKESKDHIPGAPLGCLLGVIVDAEGKPGRPFPIKSQLEMNPKESGKLFLKVNVPEGTRCSGKLKIQVSGYIATQK